jgi:hypothetical protein
MELWLFLDDLASYLVYLGFLVFVKFLVKLLKLLFINLVKFTFVSNVKHDGILGIEVLKQV